MAHWLRRIRGTVGMGVIWAAGWAAVGALIELLANLIPGLPLVGLVDIWIFELALPGFFLGVWFAVVVQVLGGRRSFAEMSVLRFGAWGALGTLTLFGLAVVTGALTITSGWTRAALILTPVTLLSALSAAGTLALARQATARPALAADGARRRIDERA